MNTFYGYQLTLAFYEKGESIKDYSSGKAEDLVAVFSNYLDTNLSYKKESTSSQRVELGRMNLSSLRYNKQLYKPNCMQASIECDTGLKGAMLELADLFKEARAKLEVVCYNENEDSKGIKSISKDKGVASKLIADKYEVYESSPRYDKAQKKMYMDLVMYSPDKVLDTFEYSKAYTNKRLGLDILKTEAAAISPALEIECKNMQVLRLASGEEFIQPYLVQYNETFYSFLSRVANRCGEFLYYDDTTGKLSLGTKPAAGAGGTNEGGKTGETKQYDFQDSDFDKISFTDFNTSHDKDGELEDFYANYMVKDTLKPTRNYVRNSELSGNEYFETVEKGEFSKRSDEEKYAGYSLYHTISKVFTNTMGAGLFLAAVNLYKEHEVDIIGWVDAVNKHFDEKFFKDGDETTKRLFGSADSITSVGEGTVNVNSVFYPLVRDKELACKRKKVSLQILSDISKNVMLGSRINFFNVEYIVVDVSASFDVVVGDKGSTAIRQPINVVAIPVDGTPMPTSSVDPIRKVGCQKAYVTDVDDPSFLGRVRVRFCWQKDDVDSSPWIRVCTQMANSNGGTAFFKAAVGDSVLIEFENGNIDMPYVAGFLPTMAQQKNKGQYLSRRNSVVVSSEHGQMMLMSDPEKGNNYFGLEALPSMIAPLGLALPDAKYENTKPRFLGATEFTDYYGTYSVRMSSTDRSVSINSPFGNVEVNAFTGITINAPQGDVNITGKNVNISALNNISIESGLNAKTGSFRYTMDLILGAAGDFLAGTVMPMALDLSYIRNILEIFIRPCEGTLSIKGGRYLMMQAGGAAAKIPFTGFVIPKGGTVNFDPEKDKIATLLTALNVSDGAVRTIAYNFSEINRIKKEVQKTWYSEFFFTDKDGNRKLKIESGCCSLEELVKRANAPQDQGPNLLEEEIAPQQSGLFKDFKVTEDYRIYLRDEYIMTLAKASRGYYRGPDVIPDYVPSCAASQDELAFLANKLVRKLRTAMASSGYGLKMSDDKKSINTSISDDMIDNDVTRLLNKSGAGGYKKAITDGLEAVIKDGLQEGKYDDIAVKGYKRKLAAAILKYAYEKVHIDGLKEPAVIVDFSNDDAWKKYVKTVFAGMDVGKLGHLGASAINAGKMLIDKLNPLQQVSGKWAQGFRNWKTERRGQILMSDTEGKTMYFNNGTLKSFSNSDLYSVKTYCENYL